MRPVAGQHLLSAVCDEVAGADTVSWELHPLAIGSDCSDSVCIDLAVPQLSSQQLQVCYGCNIGCLCLACTMAVLHASVLN